MEVEARTEREKKEIEIVIGSAIWEVSNGGSRSITEVKLRRAGSVFAWETC